MRYQVLFALSLGAVLLAGPGFAQDDIDYDDQLIEACLMGKVSMLERESCIGLASSRCQMTDAGASNAGMSMCFRRELQQWDVRLNATYQALLAQEEAEDAEMRELGSHAPEQAGALQAMQRAWIVWRDASCVFEATQWGGGSGAGPAAVHCEMQMTGKQALALALRLREQALQ